MNKNKEITHVVKGLQALDGTNDPLMIDIKVLGQIERVCLVVLGEIVQYLLGELCGHRAMIFRSSVRGESAAYAVYVRAYRTLNEVLLEPRVSRRLYLSTQETAGYATGLWSSLVCAAPLHARALYYNTEPSEDLTYIMVPALHDDIDYVFTYDHLSMKMNELDIIIHCQSILHAACWYVVGICIHYSYNRLPC